MYITVIFLVIHVSYSAFSRRLTSLTTFLYHSKKEEGLNCRPGELGSYRENICLIVKRRGDKLALMNSTVIWEIISVYPTAKSRL